jgi:hypothetical protein
MAALLFYGLLILFHRLRRSLAERTARQESVEEASA